MKVFELFEGMLTEDRIEYTANQYKDKLLSAAKADDSYKGEMDAEAIANKLAEADPQKGKNIQFIVRMYTNKQFKMEDIGRLKDDLGLFLKHKAKLEKKDLNAYANLDEFYDVTEKLADQKAPVSGKEAVRQIKAGAVKIMDEPGFLVVHPKTREAATYYGANTKWCTAAENDNRFDYYNNMGDLLVLIVDLDGQQRKFQLHYESDQFMNERDQSVSAADIAKLSKLPAYTKFLNMLIHKHYKPAIDALEGKL